MSKHDVHITIEADRTDVDPLAVHSAVLERALRQGRSARGAARNVRFVPTQHIDCGSDEALALLEEVSRARMRPENAISISHTCYLLIRESERLMQAALRGQREHLARFVPALRRSAELLADFALRYRHDPKRMNVVIEQSGAQPARAHGGVGFQEPVIDEAHRQVVWTARARVERALELLGAAREAAEHGVDPQRRKAAKLSDGELARWCAEHGLLEASLLRVDADDNVLGHSIQECGLMALWTSIKQLIGVWPHLPCTPHVFRLMQELRRRTNFFLTYRESTDARSVSGSALRTLAQRSQRQVMGLALELWQRPGGGRDSTVRRTLLNMPALVDFTDRYAHINVRFLVESERVFASVERSLRQMCGFRWHRRTHASCVACAALASARTDGAALLARFERVCSAETAGVFKDALSGAFRARVYNMYVSPSVAERFRHYNPADTATARSILSREAPATYRTVTERYVEPTIDVAWSQHLAGRPREPAHALFAAIAAGYFMKQRASGLKLEQYVVDVDQVLDPHLYRDERRGFVRRDGVDSGLHIEHQTTGTLRFRNRQAPADGVGAPLASQLYEHPLIVRSMNSSFLYYNGTMHRCDGGFHEAFAAWLECMCLDQHIGGQSGGGALLFDAWRQMASPARFGAIDAAEARTRRRLREWDPVRQVFNCDNEVRRIERQDRGADVDEPMTQF